MKRKRFFGQLLFVLFFISVGVFLFWCYLMYYSYTHNDIIWAILKYSSMITAATWLVFSIIFWVAIFSGDSDNADDSKETIEKKTNPKSD